MKDLAKYKDYLKEHAHSMYQELADIHFPETVSQQNCPYSVALATQIGEALSVPCRSHFAHTVKFNLDYAGAYDIYVSTSCYIGFYFFLIGISRHMGGSLKWNSVSVSPKLSYPFTVVINAEAMADALPLPRGPHLILNDQSVWEAHFFHGRPSCSVDNVC